LFKKVPVEWKEKEKDVRPHKEGNGRRAGH